MSALRLLRPSTLILLLAAGAGLCAQEKKEDLPAFDFLYGKRELFPAALVCFAEPPAGFDDKTPRDETQLGDIRGVISVKLKAPRDGALVRVTFTETAIFEQSHVALRLPKQGVVYRVAPVMRYRHEKLAALKQPLANLVIHARVEFPEDTAPAAASFELTERVLVHSVNDAILGYRQRDDGTSGPAWNFDIKYMLAAYANENNPWIDQRIMRHALDQAYVASFRGYLTDDSGVKAQAEAVYNTLRDFGFKYSIFAQASAEPLAGRENLRIHAVRLPGETLLSGQASGLEAALLLASVFRKMELDTVVLMIPERPTGRENDLEPLLRTVLGLYLKRGRTFESLLVIDPSRIGHEDFAGAVKAGASYYTAEADRNLFFFGDDKDQRRAAAEKKHYLAIDIGEARASGILPIPEVRREFPAMAARTEAIVPLGALPRATATLLGLPLPSWLDEDTAIIIGTIVIVALIYKFGLKKKKPRPASSDSPPSSP
jgi:hypothetical protein